MQIAIKNKTVLQGVIAAASFGTGAAVSYFVTRKVLDVKYEALLTEQLLAAKEYYKKYNKQEEYSTPQKVLSETQGNSYGAILKPYNPPRKTEPTRPPEEEEDTVSESEEWDQDAELAERSEDKPYIIHHDEFFHGEIDYDQVSLTYFDGDDVLVDEKDEPVDDPDDLVGDNLKFGHGSKDNKIVYIRNDRRQLDIEVIESKGYYVKEVLGFIEHSDDPGRPRKFRRDYE